MIRRPPLVFALVVCLLGTSPLLAVTRTWTGAASSFWSNPANWSPAGTPTAADSLVFPAGASNTFPMNNDLPAGTSVGPMNFSGSYSLWGNALTLTGDINGPVTCNVELKLANSLKIVSSNYNYAIDINGKTLTIETNIYGGSIFGPLNGNGAIVVTGGGLLILGNGTFSGTINGPLHVRGSLPNATVTSSWLRGEGTIGNTTAGDLSPGDELVCCDIPDVGTLHTKSLVLNGPTRFDMSSGQLADQVQVNGSVTVGGAMTLSALGGGYPAEGKTFVVIDNDGIDAVTGTFSGLPEGATFPVQLQSPSATVTFSISYHGGDGNDVVLTVAASQKRWIGAASGLWSNPQNWSVQTIPAPGQPLLFPAGASNLSMTNDLPAGTIVGSLQIDDSYTLSGNELTVSGYFSFHNGPSVFVCNVGLKLGSSSSMGGEMTTTFNGPIDVNGQTLTINPATQAGHRTTIGPLNGTGTVEVFGLGVNQEGSGTFSGTIKGHLNVLGSLPNATVTTSGRLSGTGTIGNTAVTGGLLPGNEPGCCSSPPAAGVLHTKSLTLGGHARFDLVPGGTSDQVQVTGSVHAGGALMLAILSGAPAAGQSFTIIDNDGSDPVSGTFTGLSERSEITVASHRFRISYAGGDGNDVVVAAVAETVTVLTQSSASTRFGEAVTLTANITSPAMPVGSVTFTADGASIGTVPVQNGVATLALSTLEVGTRNLSATFLGSGGFADSASGAISHAVTRGATTSAVVSSNPASLYGQTLSFTVTVAVLAPASGQPSGQVTVFADGATAGTATLSNGSAAVQTSALNAGSKSITATYAGDAHFEQSNAAAVPQVIGKVPTAIDARLPTPILVGVAPSVTVTVMANGSSAIPAGTVSVAEGTTVLKQQTLGGGSAQLALPPLGAGEHLLLVRYAGDGDFEPSSVNLTLTVGLTALVIGGAEVMEGNDGIKTVMLPITLSAPPALPVRVSFITVPGTATGGVDYESASGVVEFAPGEQSRAIELHVFGDAVFEADETFSVLLSSPVNASINTPSALVVIANDDKAPARRRPSRH